MSAEHLTIKQLCFTGPLKEDACLTFHEGLNILFGASDTGKSFVQEAIDFMLGGGEALRDIPERVGYDRIWLTLAKADSTEVTLARSTEGGDFNLYEGRHSKVPDGIRPETLKAKHDAKKNSNISTFVLSLVGLGNKKIRIRTDGTIGNFTLPYLRHLSVVGDSDIESKKSPLLAKDYPNPTGDISAFKLLLTGVDDSALIKSDGANNDTKLRDAKLEVIDELIKSAEIRFREFLPGSAGDEIDAQIVKLDAAILDEQEQLNSTESIYLELSSARTKLRVDLESSTERKGEVLEMLQRFDLLMKHYASDIARLEGIEEAGSLISALAKGPCPLCGASANEAHIEIPCDANLSTVVGAASAERAKIELLRRELGGTVQKLRVEAGQFEQSIPETRTQLAATEARLAKLVPSVNEKRTSFQTLVESRAGFRAGASIWNELTELRGRKSTLEPVAESQGVETPQVSEIPSSVLESFSRLFEAILKTWRFPNAERIHFDSKSKDFIIAGKPRGSRGRGLRAITHAAFTVALLEFCKRQQRPHLGFIVMDSPLLAYRKPDSKKGAPDAADMELAQSGLNHEFFSYLSKWTDRQAIIIENIDPPDEFTKEKYSIKFSGNPEIGRAGLFPWLEQPFSNESQ